MSRRQQGLASILAFAIVLAAAQPARSEDPVVIGSKPFGEAYLLAEMAAALLEDRGYSVDRRLGLGGTAIVFGATEVGEIDLYSEYTGTLTRAVFKAPDMTLAELDAALARRGLAFHVRFGFVNNYAIAVPSTVARERRLQRVSDLRDEADLRLGFSYEFMNRGDGWPAMRRLYELPQEASALEHALAYRALDSGQLDATDAYTTDGDLALYDLTLLEDDLDLFPTYYAGILLRRDLPAGVLRVLEELEGFLDEATMQALNQRVSSDGESAAAVAVDHLQRAGLIAPPEKTSARKSRIGHNTLVHLKLTAVAVLLACVVAIPLALAVSRLPRFASALQYTAGLIQTIPALALLALMIPFLGLGQVTAIIALFLYSLLPIVRNTLAGLFSVDPLLKDVAASMGMTAFQQTLRIDLPLAMPMILAGIRTAAVISIGTATLAAFVGAGGLGQPILTGLSLNDNQLILEGAVPAALLAISVEWLFEMAERRLVPAHLRVSG